MKKTTEDLVIIGGGAAGLAAAVTAKAIAPKLGVTILEKKESPGKKLRATGNGRCNITNSALPSAPSTIAFFEGLGIPTRQDSEGRVYPFSESAPGVVDVFKGQLSALEVELKTNTAVQSLAFDEGFFIIGTNHDRYRAKAVILSTGGKAGPVYGCSGDGYTLAKALGHNITKTLPVLTGVCCADLPKNLGGIRVKGQLTLLCRHQPIFSEAGEIQFTDYGISGICVFNLSRYLKYLAEEKLEPYHLQIDLAPQHSFSEMFFNWQKNAVLSKKSSIDILSGIFKPPIAEKLLNDAGISLQKNFSHFSEEEIILLERQCHHFCLKPVSTMGFKMAQCTAGGIEAEEIDPSTLGSKIVPHLYFAGEILDYDGPCGGYNLDHAFRTGRQAAKSAINSITQGANHV